LAGASSTTSSSASRGVWTRRPALFIGDEGAEGELKKIEVVDEHARKGDALTIAMRWLGGGLVQVFSVVAVALFVFGSINALALPLGAWLGARPGLAQPGAQPAKP
jgi:hypothetical protein